jgi:2-haloacid dehalogenase
MLDQYEPFSALTRRSLRHALAESNVTLSGAEMDSLMESYDSLSTFPDVKPALDALASAQGITCVVFSNGTLPMVTNSVHKSPDLAPHASLFADIVVVEEVKKFKPCPEVYLYLAERVGKKKDEMADIWLVSGNPFDVVGARALGMNVAWVDRQGNGWQDSLIDGTAGKPTVVVRGLEEVLDKVHAHISKD